MIPDGTPLAAGRYRKVVVIVSPAFAVSGMAMVVVTVTVFP